MYKIFYYLIIISTLITTLSSSFKFDNLKNDFGFNSYLFDSLDDKGYVLDTHNKYYCLFQVLNEMIDDDIGKDSILEVYYDKNVLFIDTSSKERIDIGKWQSPPYKFYYENTNAEDTLIKEGYAITFPFDWNRDMLPDDPTWLFSLHNMKWLNLYLRSGGKDSVLFAFKVINDWILSNTMYPGGNRFTWHDHPTALRLKIFTQALNIYNCNEFIDPVFNRNLLIGILSHIALLTSQEKYWVGHNHGIIVDMTLLNVMEKLEEFKFRDEVNKVAKIRLFDQLTYTFTEDGVHKEHSACYQYFIFRRLKESIKHFSDEPAYARQLNDLAHKAGEFLAYLLRPDFTLPKIGDCYSEKPLPKKLLVDLIRTDAGYNSIHDDTLLDRLFFALDEIRVFAKSGWAVFRSCHVPAIHIAVQSDFFNFSHYQKDDMSFVLHAEGRDLIIDPGLLGYGNDDFSVYFRKSTRAHNVLLVDGNDYNYNLEKTGLSGITRSYIDSMGKEWGGIVEFTHPHYSFLGIEIFRQFGKINDTCYVIRDITKSDSNRLYQRLFHLAPGSKITNPQTGYYVATWPDFEFNLWIICTADEFRIIKGETNPIQGWHSPAFGVKVSAPVLFLDNTGRDLDEKVFLVISRNTKAPSINHLTRRYEVLVNQLEKEERRELQRHYIPEKWLSR